LRGASAQRSELCSPALGVFASRVWAQLPNYIEDVATGDLECTDHQAKYVAYGLTGLPPSGAETLSMLLLSNRPRHHGGDRSSWDAIADRHAASELVALSDASGAPRLTSIWLDHLGREGSKSCSTNVRSPASPLSSQTTTIGLSSSSSSQTIPTTALPSTWMIQSPTALRRRATRSRSDADMSRLLLQALYRAPRQRRDLCPQNGLDASNPMVGV
jgi:hypothetical protein